MQVNVEFSYISAVSYPGDASPFLTLYDNILCDPDGSETVGFSESPFYTSIHGTFPDPFGARAPSPGSKYCSESEEAPDGDFVFTARDTAEFMNVQAVRYCNLQ